MTDQRVHVVLFTVVCVVGASIAVGAVVTWAVKDRPQTEAIGWSPAQTAILNDFVGICETPTYTFGDLEVGLLDAVQMPVGGYALHFAVHGPISIRHDDEDGNSFLQTTSFLVLEDEGARANLVSAQPGITWGHTYVEASASAGPRIELLIQGPSLDEPQMFTVDTGTLRSGC